MPSAIAALVISAAPASAGTYYYNKDGPIGPHPSIIHSTYVYHYTTATGAASDASYHQVVTAAEYADGTQYANWTSAAAAVCHSYAGNQELGGRYMNNNSVTQWPTSGFVQANGPGC